VVSKDSHPAPSDVLTQIGQMGWPQTVEAAIAIQQELSSEVVITDQLDSVDYVAGVDVGFKANGTITQAAVVVLSFPALERIESAVVQCPTTFPYIPGLLSFREIPAILTALDQIQCRPNLILCDGQGLAHPRRFGLACHLGVLTNIPTLGAAKSRLLGTHDELAPEKGCWQSLHHRDEVVGAVLRTRTNVKPLYVSIGHRIGLATAIEYVLRCTPKYRLPETTRWADNLASDRGKKI